MNVQQHAGGTASCEQQAACSVCGQRYGSALGHNLVDDKGYAATCTRDGLTDGQHCTRCAYKIEQKVIPATAHSYQDGKCTVCGLATPGTGTPKTGDTSNVVLWGLLMFAAGAVIVGIALYSGKKTVKR